MTIYQDVTKSEFRDAFHNMNRGDQFSYAAIGALYDYLDELSQDTGEPIKLDVIAICCDYCEYDDLDEVKANYRDIEDMEDLQNHTTVIELDKGGLVIQNF